MFKYRLFFIILLLFITSIAFSSERKVPKKPVLEKVDISFNGEEINGQYVLLDVRTEEEKERNRKNNRLDGAVLVFFHGHSQRPDDGYYLISDFAKKSKSGIIIVPVCDTPFGKENFFHGDNGKNIILMEMVRYALYKNNIYLDGFKSLTDKPVIISEFNYSMSHDKMIPVKLSALGWSHGSLLARRMTSIYPGLFNSLGQMAPAGYDTWAGGKMCLGSGCLLANFSWEGMRIGTGIFRGEGKYVWDSGMGIVKGVGGDVFRSFGSCIWGNVDLIKPFRNYDDIYGCSILVNDNNFSVSHINNLIIIFGENDSLFQDDKHFKNPKSITKKEEDAFWSKYYPSLFNKKGMKKKVTVFKGNHIGPLVYHKKYSTALLKGVGELKGH